MLLSFSEMYGALDRELFLFIDPFVVIANRIYSMIDI